ncbi:hypothetical protein FN924_15555 [Radiobacillus deserti]|uniref:protein-tyrosine-phosphatase n=1 Tax=Radiobacillus deserti TaxID=2594883 RepID=A0A516KJA1_9BACI|nr:hypothetical protein FN924_15555 [Radiobacillus deserti]
MIDISCKILPGLGHSARHAEEGVAIAKEVAKQGIRKIIATPSRIEDVGTQKMEVVKQVHLLNKRLIAESIPVMILPRQEISSNENIVSGLQDGDIIPLHTSGYL